MTEEQMKQKWCSRTLAPTNNNANSRIFGIANVDTDVNGAPSIGGHKCFGSACVAYQQMMVFDPVSKTQVMTSYCAEMSQRPLMP